MTINVLKDSLCINLDIGSWTGSRTIKLDDNAFNGEKPPVELSSFMENLKLCDPTVITKLNSAKRALERDLEAFCIKFLGGWLTSERFTQRAIDILEQHKKIYLSKRQEHLNELMSEVDDWCSKYPKWKDKIKNALPSIAYLEKQIRFDYQIFNVGVPDNTSTSSTINKSLINATNGLSGQLFQEIEKKAKEAWDKTFKGRDKIDRKALRPICYIRDKLNDLSYLDIRTIPLVNHIQMVLDAIPKTGKIEGNTLMSLVGLVHLMSDANRFVSHGEALMAKQHGDNGMNVTPQTQSNNVLDFEVKVDTDEEEAMPSDTSGSPDKKSDVVQSDVTQSVTQVANTGGRGLW